MTPTVSNLIKNRRKLFFVGIGGISMSSLALIARNAGCEVAGSDRNSSPLVEACREAGCSIVIGHREDSVIGADALIYTAAVSTDSPELKKARELNIPCLSRAEFLGELMLDYGTRIGISGTHGKTTTTSMVAQILIMCGKDPTVAGGATAKVLNDSALRIGGKNYFAYEACEYKASFHSFHPTVAVITNVELDHTDYYTSLAHMVESFATSLKDAAYAVINGDDENAIKAAKDFQGQKVRFSLEDPSADYYAHKIRAEEAVTCYTLQYRGQTVGEVALPMIGKYNVANSLAALAACHLAGVSLEDAIPTLTDFEGAARRFEIKYRKNGITVADDYAHHPSEVRAVLAGVKSLGFSRVITVFQSHTYSRTHDLFDDFAQALKASDLVFMPDIYAARETDTKGVSSALLCQAIGDKAVYMEKFEDIAAHLATIAREGDLILTMGAGDVYKIGNLFIQALEK